jgi:ABC-type transporter Mla subunit MlaD
MVGEHDNFKAGLFVLVGLILGATVIFVLGDWSSLMERKQQVKVYFTLDDGLQGLKTGATVTVGDQAVGSVAGIEDHMSAGEGDAEPRVVGKIVTIEIPQRYKLYWNAQIELVAPPLGSGTRLNIASVGNGDRYDPDAPLPASAVPAIFVARGIAWQGPPGAIPGSIAGSTLTRNFVADLGIEELQKQQIRDIIANVQVLTGKLREDVPVITTKVRGMMDKFEPVVGTMGEALGNVRDVTATVKESTPRWIARIDGITTKADETLGTVQTLVTDKAPTIRATLDNVHDITAKVKETNLQQITDALEQGKQALSNAREATANMRDMVVGQRPVLERALANAQLTTDQLKLAAIEIRRSPWRLLYKPKDQELETDNLYDATRSFSLAAGALDSAAQSLRAVAQHPDAAANDLGPMLDHLEKLFGRFEEAEKAFWEALKGRTPQK